MTKENIIEGMKTSIRLLNQVHVLAKAAQSCIQEDEASTHVKAVMQLGGVDRKLFELDNLIRALDEPLRRSFSDIADLFEKEAVQAQEAAAVKGLIPENKEEA